MLFEKTSKILFVIIAVSILILSIIPVTPKEFGNLSDKATHLIAYGVLACAFIFAFRSRKIHFLLLSVISVLACTLYGGAIEILQNFFHRSPELLDFLANLIGAAAGTLVATVFVMLMKKWQP